VRYQEPLPGEYRALSREQLLPRIAARKGQLGADLCLLGHHYQRDEVFQFADFTGDSLKLSQQASAAKAKYIVFCGVHFMAESAEIITGGQRVVILPDASAGCAMSEMADADDVEEALEIVSASAAGAKVVPVTYVNSSAAVKALTGRAGGACCTSSNARSVFQWALAPAAEGGAGGGKVFAVPDQHLGRNTAAAMGFGEDQCAVYDWRKDRGGLSEEQIRRVRFILWKGHCYVHQRFTVEQIHGVRRLRPGIKVMVHPECPEEVVRAADSAGSTEQILRAVTDSAPGSSWAIGTEANMVRRLAANNPDKYVRVLSDAPPLCVTMGKIDLPHLLWVLDNLAEGRIVNRVTVPPDVAADARLALERMLALAPAAPAVNRTLD
jgi:quinolinate synthase